MENIKVQRERLALLERVEQRLKDIEALEEKGYKSAISRKKTEDEILSLKEKIWRGSSQFSANELSIGKQIENLQSSAFNTLNKSVKLEQTIITAKDVQKNGTKAQQKEMNKFLGILHKVNDGSMDAKDIYEAIAEGGLEDMEETLKEIAETLEKTPNLSRQLELESGVQQKINSFYDKIEEYSAIASSGKLMGAAAIGLAAKLATDFANKALDIRKELGTSAVDSARLAGNMSVASFQAKLLGGDTQQAASAVTSLTREFGSLDAVSSSVARQAGSITAQFGISGENLGRLVKQMSALNGGSLETNINTLETVGNLARAARVAPADVLNDLAESTETFAKFSMQGGKNLARAAIEARKLGLSLQTVDKISESILDFETSIEKQMEASLLIGRQLNLDKARQLALEGDLEGVLAEVKNQVGGAEQLSKMNVIQRKALADAVGLEVSELSKLAAGQKGVNAAAAAQKATMVSTFATVVGIATVLGGIVGMLTGGAAVKKMAKGAIKGAGVGAGIGVLGGAAAAVGQQYLPKAQTGGVVRETGMAVIHKGETISGTAGQFGTETNKLLRELISQNEILMGRLTNKVGDLALS